MSRPKWLMKTWSTDVLATWSTISTLTWWYLTLSGGMSCPGRGFGMMKPSARSAGAAAVRATSAARTARPLRRCPWLMRSSLKVLGDRFLHPLIQPARPFCSIGFRPGGRSVKGDLFSEQVLEAVPQNPDRRKDLDGAAGEPLRVVGQEEDRVDPGVEGGQDIEMSVSDDPALLRL